MLDKKEIINTLKKYNLDSNNYIVISGAAMVLLGIKDKARDIDISVTKDYYNYLLKNYNCTLERINEYNNKVYFIDEVINFGIDYFDTDYIEIDGIYVQKPEAIIKLKKSLNREKDRKDIELINKAKQVNKGNI